MLDVTYPFSFLFIDISHFADDNKPSVIIHDTWLQLQLPQVVNNMPLYSLAKLIIGKCTELLVEQPDTLRDELPPTEGGEAHHPPDPVHRRTRTIVDLAGSFAQWRSAQQSDLAALDELQKHRKDGQRSAK